MKPTRYRIASVAVLTLIPSLAISAPQIQSYSGELQAGAEITLSGSEFGSQAPSFILKDSADDYTFLSEMERQSSINHANLWTQKGSNWAAPLEPNATTSLGRGNDNIIYGGVGKAFMGWPETLSNQTNTSLFVSWWFNPSSDPGASGGSNKFLRVWDARNGEHTRMAWDQMHIVYWRKDVDEGGNIQWGNWNGKVGEWNRIDAWMDADANVMQVRVNGNKVIDVNDFSKSSVDSGLTVGLIGFDPSVASNYDSLKFGVDDIYISDSQARVEISNSPHWSDPSNVREIQTPTKWSDSELKFELSTGVVDLSQPLYIYVINSNGDVNEKGFSLSSRAPSAINDLLIE